MHAHVVCHVHVAMAHVHAHVHVHAHAHVTCACSDVGAVLATLGALIERRVVVCVGVGADKVALWNLI